MSDCEDQPLASEDRAELLRIARVALKQWFFDGRAPVGAPHRESLLAPRSAFVTLRIDGEVRGRFGRLDADLPLFRAIIDLTVGSATRDPRYEAVRREELPALKIEISLLSPLARLGDKAAIEIGRHGLVVTRGASHGLLLPGIAVERAWSRETFLAETCRMAGLAASAWSEAETEVATFTTQVFAEP